MIATCSLAILIIVAQTAPAGVTSRQFQSFRTEEKQSALRSLGSGPEVVPATSMDLFETGLVDDAARVRYSAISALGRIAQRAASAPAGEQMAELRKRASLRPALVRARDDPDFRIRGGAVSVLTVMGLTTVSSVAERLIRQYKIETDARVRALLVKVVGSQASNLPTAHEVVLHALEDPASEVQHAAIRATFSYQPMEALPLLASTLLNMEPTLRQDAVHAIALYGPSAKPHLDVLRALLSVESDPARIQQIERAIAAIGGSPAQ